MWGSRTISQSWSVGGQGRPALSNASPASNGPHGRLPGASSLRGPPAASTPPLPPAGPVGNSPHPAGAEEKAEAGDGGGPAMHAPLCSHQWCRGLCSGGVLVSSPSPTSVARAPATPTFPVSCADGTLFIVWHILKRKNTWKHFLLSANMEQTEDRRKHGHSD